MPRDPVSEPVRVRGQTHGQPQRASSHLKHNAFKLFNNIRASVTGLSGLNENLYNQSL